MVDSVDVPIDHAKIRRLREQQGMSLIQLAAKVSSSMTAGRMSRIETGAVRNITVETLDAIARALKVKARDLLR